MSNKEQAFQRCLDSAAELEGGSDCQGRSGDQPADFLPCRSTLG